MADDTFPHCVTLDLDCAAVCRLAAATMAHDSGFAQRFGAMCAEICAQCGEACDRSGAGHACHDCTPARSELGA